MVDSVYAQFLTCGISFAQRSRIGRISPSLACGPLWPWRAHEKPHHVVNMNLGFFERQHKSAHGEETFPGRIWQWAARMAARLGGPIAGGLHGGGAPHFAMGGPH